MKKYVKYEWPFSMLHRQVAGNKVKIMITLAVKPALEGLAAAFYMDGSGSMEESGNYGSRGRLVRLLEREGLRNPVSEAMQGIVPYIAGKDATLSCRTAYWACGSVRQLATHKKRWRETVQVIGELSPKEAAKTEFVGPHQFGNATHLLPPVRDFVEYINGLIAEGENVKVAAAVIVTDGKFHDLEDVLAYSKEYLGPSIMSGDFPRTNFSIVGVGPDINQKQMAKLMRMGSPTDYPGMGIWSFAFADSIDDLSEVVSHLVDKNTPAFFGGAYVTDDKGEVLIAFEDMVPAVVEIEVPKATKSFTLKVGDKSFTKIISDIPLGYMGMSGDDDKGKMSGMA